MARQKGPVFYTGTIDHITYYKLFGEHYYLRSKSTLTGQRFFRDPAFERSRRRSREFGGAAQLASAIYKRLPKANRGRGFMGKLIGQVHRALVAGKTAAVVQEEVLKVFGVKTISFTNEKPSTQKPSFPSEAKAESSLLHWVVSAGGNLKQSTTLPPDSIPSYQPRPPISCYTCRPPDQANE